MNTTADAMDTSDREIVLTRVLNAPRELVYDAFFDRENISRWWGPNGFSTTTKTMDVRVGGVWEYVMHGPDGTDYPNRMAYTRLDRPSGFAYDHGTGAEQPRLFVAEGRLVDLGGGRTELTLRMVWDTREERDFMELEYGAREGGEQMLERLAELLASRT
ncbi:MAG TPA: SRPBCC domain-containing protein [Pirellulaceae bacterium]|nr:SRPBCC domain-containing protein [Pirellulaceae bacterium]